MAGIRIEGLGELSRALARLASGITQGATEGQAAVADGVADEWRAGVPVDTGEYQGSIATDETGAFATARHSPYVEYGTSTHTAVPAGSTAAASWRTKMPKAVADRVRRRI